MDRARRNRGGEYREATEAGAAQRSGRVPRGGKGVSEFCLEGDTQLGHGDKVEARVEGASEIRYRVGEGNGKAGGGDGGSHCNGLSKNRDDWCKVIKCRRPAGLQSMRDMLAKVGIEAGSKGKDARVVCEANAKVDKGRKAEARQPEVRTDDETGTPETWGDSPMETVVDPG